MRHATARALCKIRMRQSNCFVCTLQAITEQGVFGDPLAWLILLCLLYVLSCSMTLLFVAIVSMVR